MAESSGIALIDMDGVVAELHDDFGARMRAQFPDIPTLNGRIEYYPTRSYAREHRDAAWEILATPGLFANLPLIPGSLDGWERILRAGVRPRICSSPVEQNPHCKDEKLAWLDQHFVPEFGAWVVNEAIITMDKAAQDGIVLIDDYPTPIRDADTASWQQVRFVRSYNRDSLIVPALDGWHDPVLPDILAQAAQKQTNK